MMAKGGYTSFGDMFDGGGAGASGGHFQGGGVVSAVGNALTGNRGMGVGQDSGVGFAGFGYQGPDGWVSAGRDMLNGGGAGVAGSNFYGAGGYSGLLNMVGINPMGYGQRMDSLGAVRPQMRPQMGMQAPQQAAPMVPQPAPRPMSGPQYMPTQFQPMAARSATDPFIGLDRFLNAPQPAPMISGDPRVAYQGSAVRRAMR